MNIIEALKQEKIKLDRQLTAVQEAIDALSNGSKGAVSARQALTSNGNSGKRTMSAAVRAKISRAASARWAKIRAKQTKGK